ncbi:hypothetical protein HDV02_004379 [Globomyces sp. JEL0801]|nr:hypothetical protein HDV02_004379 [Globomyces sp. JEL0801]
MKFVHMSCLTKWMETKEIYYQCEVCHYKYNIQRRFNTSKILKSTWLTIAVFAILTIAMIALCGLLTPYTLPIFVSLRIDGIPHWAKFIITGTVAYGIIGFLFSIIHMTMVCCGKSTENNWKSRAPTRSYHRNDSCNHWAFWYLSCSPNDCGDCGGCDGDAGKDGCLIVCGIVAALAAIAGIIYLFTIGYMALFAIIEGYLDEKSWQALNEKTKPTKK